MSLWRGQEQCGTPSGCLILGGEVAAERREGGQATHLEVHFGRAE